MYYLINAIETAFTLYNLMLIMRILSSWFPSFQGTPIMRFVTYYTDPYLNIFRRLIPPIGGMLDLSPILAFLSLNFIKRLLITILLQ